MFTGIVEELGSVTAREPGTLAVHGPVVTADLKPGDSVAVNGVCLTATEIVNGVGFHADVMTETLRRTALDRLRVGEEVNLERAVTPHTRLGGHLVQGHVDGVGTVLAGPPQLRVGLPPGLARYLVTKGSITVDGVSLTVVEVTDEWFEVSLIPTTLAATTLGRTSAGDPVNLEVDVIAKYVEKLAAGFVPAGQPGPVAGGTP